MGADKSGGKNKGVFMISCIGLHLGGGEDVEQEVIKYNQELRTQLFQVFAGNPQKYHIPRVFPFLERFEKQFQFVVHLPYWTLCLSEKNHLTKKYVHEVRFHFGSVIFGPIWCVVHVGTGKGNQQELYDQLVNFLNTFKFQKPAGFKLLLENTVGAKTADSPSLAALAKVAKEYEWVGVCLDTQHAYAAGEQLPESTSAVWAEVDLIHLNAVPPYVKFGGHLDRHSWTPLSRSRPEIFNWIGEIKRNKKIFPIILERRDRTIFKQDIEFLND